jgi:hypothetical protein
MWDIPAATRSKDIHEKKYLPVAALCALLSAAALAL